jgi:sarcosine oxidase
MTLWRLAHRGIRAVGFDQYSPGHDRSAAGGETRLFRTAYLEDPRYVPVLREAQRLWRELEHESGRQLLHLTGGLMMGAEDSPGMRNIQTSISEYGLRHEVLDPETFMQRYPYHRLLPGDRAILDLDAGFLRSELAVLAAANRAVELGASIERYVRVDAVIPDVHGVRVLTANGEQRFRKVVVAPGPWAGQLVPALRTVLEVRRPVQAWFVPRHPAWFDSERAPIFLRTSEARLYGIPSVDGVAVKVGLWAAMHRVVDDPDHLDRTIRRDEIMRFREVVEHFLPDLHPDPIRLGAYMEAYTPDHHALVGPLPGAEQIIVLCGFSGHGFKLAPLMGDIAADFILEGRTERAVEYLLPHRLLAPVQH